MSLNCGVTQASGGDSQPNSPTDMVSSMTQSQMKNFLTLKNKIIRTDDLIKRHKDVLSQLTETQTRLVSTEKGARGLKAELHVLHQEKRKLVASLTMLREEVASLGDSKREEEQLVQQLKAKLDILERKNKQYEKKAGNAQGLLDEKEKWKNMYQKLKREHKSYRSRTNSRKNSPMCPLVSPPYLSSSEELTPPTPSPPITFTVEETKKKTVVREELFVNESRCLGVEYSLEDYMVPIQMEHSPEDATEATKKKCAILKMPEFLLPPEKMPQPEVNTEKANVDSFNGDIHVNSPEDATEATKNKCAILNMPEFLLPPKKMSQPEVNTEKANVDSFDDDMVPKHSPEDAIEATKNKCALNMPEFLLPPKKILQLEVNTEKANVNSFVQDELVSAKDITDHAPIHVQDVMVAKRLEVTDPEHSITCPHICERLRSPTVAPPLSLSNQLFGDSDSDNALSVSDDSSDDERDDLAEMLESKTTTPKDNDITNKPASSINKKNFANITTVGSAADDEVSTSPMEDCNISISETNVNSIITSEVIVAEEEQMATGHVSSMTEGSNFIVPCVEVESVAADTLSSEDEMDVSFNEGSVFVLSPLPQSPIDMDAHDRSLDTPISPLPISPTNELPLSPLPQSPVQSHDDDEDMTLSPLPPSPIQSHNDNEDMTLSPLPPSPINFRLHSGVISPLPNSPVSAPGSKVITPLPASPVSVRRLTNLAPLNFADTAPCGVQAPTPCNVVVMVTSQSEEYRETTPTRSELVLSDGSPFSPPPLFIDSTKYCELVSSYCEETQNAAKATVTVDTLDLSASGDVDNGGYSSDSDKVPFIGPVLPPAHPLNNIPIAPPIDTPFSIDSQNYSTLTVPTATSIPLNDKYKLDHSTRSSTRSATNNQNSTNKQLPGGNTKKKKGKINPFQKPVPKNNSNSTSFDDLLQSFRQTSQVTNPAPRVVSNTQQTSQVKNPTPRVVSNMRQPSQVTNPAPPAASNTHQHTLKQDRRISASVEVPPSSKRPRLTSSTSSTSSTVSSTPLLCSQLPRATPVQALPGYQGDSPTDTATSKGTFPPCYRLRSRKVDFFETVKRRKKSSSCSDDSLSNETPVREGNSDSISVPQGIHGDAILSDGELSESEEEKSNQKPPPVSMITRKRRHTDGATGQEEDQTPSSSPLQLLAPPTLLQSDLSHVNCGYGKKETEVSQTKAATQTQSVDDIFSTNLPLLGQSKLSLATPTVTPIQHSGLSIVQQQLPVWLNCPLPLPDWLVAAMVGLPGLMNKSHANVVNTPNVGGKKKKKRTFVVKDPIQRQSSQKPSAFILANLERLVLGQIYLSAIIPMLSDLKHISSSSVLIKAIIEFLLHHYMPSVDVVVKLYHDQCDSVRTSPHDCQPLNPSFPPALLKPECQLLALFVHLPRMNSNMATFLSELSTALYQTIVTPGMKFHQLAAAVRLFTGVCRLQGDSERVLFMCFDLVRKPLLVNELLVISGVASVWPLPLARYSGLIVQSDGIPEVKELEKQTLCFTLETVIMTMVKEKASKLNSSLSPHMHTLCGWVHVSDNTVNLLTEKLLHMLNTSSAVYIDQPPPPPSPWRRPRPSVQAFHIVHSLRLLSYSRGWVWTNDTLIRAHLWPILKKWNSSEGSEVKDAAAVCVVRLIGFVSSQGVTADPLSSSILQLQRVLIALLTKSTPGGFSALQLAAVDSLLELCPPAHPRAAEAVGVVRVWLNGLCKHAVNSLAKEFNERLLVYRVGS